MTDYILILSIGPVQSMIGAARRSRDLWSGSWLLSELSKACAKKLKDDGATLIFPHVEEAEADAMLSPNSDFSVGNKIQVKVAAADETALKKIIKSAKDITEKRFLVEANKAKNILEDSGADKDLRQDIWNAQKNGYLEIQAAWAEIGNTGYSAAVKAATSALAARKATRDFLPAATDPYQHNLMLPKSSLDGALETVIKEENKAERQFWHSTTRRKLSLADSEQLDCLGVIKRLGFDKKAEQFTPITRVAADAWIERVLAYNPQALDAAKKAYEKLANLQVTTRVKGNQGIYDNFPYDAQYLYDSRLEIGVQEAGNDGAQLQAFDDLKKALKPLWQKHGQPYTYGILLLADGDRMGELLDSAKSLEQHQAITQALSAFAEGVASAMRKYKGHCIYAGGDDVLGLVPLHTAFDCAKQLSENFSNALKTVSTDLGATTPTLSVGLAICHIMTPFSVVRDLAKEAEKLAKGDHVPDKDERRNALGILLSVRSGSDVKLRYRWDDANALMCLADWQRQFAVKQQTLPSGVPYDIRAIYLRTQGITDDTELLKKIQAAEMTRLLKQVRTSAGDKLDIGLIKALTDRGEAIGLDKLADELITARWLAAKTSKDLGKE